MQALGCQEWRLLANHRVRGGSLVAWRGLPPCLRGTASGVRKAVWQRWVLLLLLLLLLVVVVLVVVVSSSCGGVGDRPKAPSCWERATLGLAGRPRCCRCMLSSGAA
jgi:hypothetical protein